MKFFRYIFVIVPLLVLMPGDMFSRRQPVRKMTTRRALLQENVRMRAAIDSLLQEIEALKDTSGIAESYSQDPEPVSLMDGISPETYSREVTDSLLNIWYLHRQQKTSFDAGLDMDSVRFSSNVPDKVFIERLSGMNSYITLPFNETVRNYIILYSEKMPEKMSAMMGLASYYFPIFEETLNKYDMPLELKYMAVIESALNPVAVSRAGAKGMWQFMYNTARIYGLEINSYVDERLDPFKAADAAARYMLDAYRIFGDWNLAISSYNCGAGNVNKAIRRCGDKRDFWSVYDYLPRETRGYVPAFVGAMYAFTYYREHGIVPDKVQMPSHIDTFHVHRMLHFQQVRDLTGISVEELRSLNPQYVHDIIPGNQKEYVLRLPLRYSGRFIEVEDSVYSHRTGELFNPSTLQHINDSGPGSRITYRVKSGDYLGRIASKYHVTVAQIKKWNHLKNNNLRIGQVLVIYGRGSAPASSSKASGAVASQPKASAASSSESATVKQASGGEYVTYTVRKGDTLYNISKNYPGISANDIMKYNGIGANIKPGMKIKIPVK